jgi:hypothetical protein
MRSLRAALTVTLCVALNGLIAPTHAASAGTGSGLDGVLGGVSASSPTDVWAVGRSCTACYDLGETTRTLIEHWNGTGWGKVKSPSPSTTRNALVGVAAISSSDAWAVGDYCKMNCEGDHLGDRTLLEHWDGTSWTKVKSPDPSSLGNTLYAIDAASSNDVWAVGMARVDGGSSKTLALHWDGVSWLRVGSPSPSSGFNNLYGIDASSSTDAWAVGRRTTSRGDRVLTIHWNGTSWSMVKSVNPSAQNDLAGVEGSSTDAWAVGSSARRDYSTRTTLIEHWNGAAWSTVGSVDPSSRDNVLNDVSVVSSTSLWAVGSFFGNQTNKTLIEYWDGASWSKVHSPNPSSQENHLSGVKAVSSTDAWAVGTYLTSSGYETLVEHWNGTGWRLG